MFWNSPNDNKGIIGILKDWTGEIIHKGVKEVPLARSKKEHLLQNISDNVEEEGG
jgi:hypothetical protein